MVRYYLCPIVGTGSNDDPYRSIISDTGVNYSTDIPHVSATDGTPRFSRCLVCVNGTTEQLKACEALVGVVDLLDGALTAELGKEEALGTLSRVDYVSLSTDRKAKLDLSPSALAEPNPSTGLSFKVRASKTDGTLEDWLNSLLQQQRRVAEIKNLFVGIQ